MKAELLLPIDATRRGKLRLWKAGLTNRYAAFDAWYGTRDARRLASDFAHAGSSGGRQRKLARLDHILTAFGAQLEHRQLERKHPFAVWALLRPRCAMARDDPEPRFMQDCVVVEYIAAGRLPGRTVLDSATWTLGSAITRWAD